MTGIIYKVTSPSGKVYIGQTIGQFKVRRRRHEHCAFHEKSSSYNTKFSYAIRKYKEKLLWEILYYVNEDELNLCEQIEIKKYDSYNCGYNGTLGGNDAGFRGRKHSIEAKQKLSEQKKGKNNPMYGCKGELNPFYGKKHSQQSKDLIKSNQPDWSGSNNPMFGKKSAFFGKKHSEETKIKMSKASKGRGFGKGKGYAWHENRWCVHICNTYGGRFKTEAEAIARVEELKKQFCEKKQGD